MGWSHSLSLLSSSCFITQINSHMSLSHSLLISVNHSLVPFYAMFLPSRESTSSLSCPVLVNHSQSLWRQLLNWGFHHMAESSAEMPTSGDPRHSNETLTDHKTYWTARKWAKKPRGPLFEVSAPQTTRKHKGFPVKNAPDWIGHKQVFSSLECFQTNDDTCAHMLFFSMVYQESCTTNSLKHAVHLKKFGNVPFKV